MHITSQSRLSYEPAAACRIDLYPFSQLRSLIIMGATDEKQANLLLTQSFEHLSYLDLGPFTGNMLKGSYQNLMAKIFANGFPALRVCHLPQAMRPRNIDAPSSPAIKVISLGKSTYTVLAEILACAPNATHLTVKDLADVSNLLSNFSCIAQRSPCENSKHHAFH